VVLAAVGKHGAALQYVSDYFKQDRAVVLAALEEDGMALEWACETLQSDVQVRNRKVDVKPPGNSHGARPLY